jgi:hypothetical protein
MTTKTNFVLLGIGLLGIVGLISAVAVCFLMATKWSAPYRESNATWRIEGICTNSQSGTPIKGVQVAAFFREPIAFKHHWRNPPPLATTNVVTKTDDQGRFEVTGEGGSAYIKVKAEGYREPESWEDWSYNARNGISRVDTNIALSLKPISTSAHDEKSSIQ